MSSNPPLLAGSSCYLEKLHLSINEPRKPWEKLGRIEVHLNRTNKVLPSSNLRRSDNIRQLEHTIFKQPGIK